MTSFRSSGMLGTSPPNGLARCISMAERPQLGGEDAGSNPANAQHKTDHLVGSDQNDLEVSHPLGMNGTQEEVTWSRAGQLL